MDQHEASLSTHTHLLELSEDVILTVVDFIKEWAQIQSDGYAEVEKIKARILRNSSLRAIALTSHKAFARFYLHALEEIDLENTIRLWSLYQLILRNKSYGQHVKNLYCLTSYGQLGNGEAMFNSSGQSLTSLSTLPPSDSFYERDHFHSGVTAASNACLEQMINLEVLILENPDFNPELQTKIDGRWSPMRYFSNSLKKLYIKCSESDIYSNVMSASNVVWILVFSPHLREATLGFTLDVLQDFSFLSEYYTVFEGLSQVKKLSICPMFVFDEERPDTWWGRPEEDQRIWMGGNKKNEALWKLLRVTKDLSCFEFSQKEERSKRRKGDYTNLSTQCLMGGLESSSSSLRHLRILGDLGVDPRSIPTDYSIFESLRIISFELTLLYELSDPNHQKVGTAKLPASLQILQLCYYSYGSVSDSFEEDCILAEVLKERNKKLPNLKEVVVPSSTRFPFGSFTKDPEYLSAWNKGRRVLEDSECFQTGEVGLTRLRLGANIADASEEETFMSIRRWLSS